MDPGTKRDRRLTVGGVVILVADFGLNDQPFALFSGLSNTGKPVVPVAGIVVGVLFFVYGLLSLAGVVSGSTQWEGEERGSR